MTESRESIVLLHQQKLKLLKECLQLMEGKALLMMSNNLHLLEQSIEPEASLVRNLNEVNGSIREWCKESTLAAQEGRELGVEEILERVPSETADQLARLVREIEKTVVDIRRVKQKNTALVDNGLQFSVALLGTICPPQTYNPTGGGAVIPSNSLFSVSY